MSFTKSTAALSVALMGYYASAQGVTSNEMGPAAFLWPEDRPWSPGADNTAPCGSAYGVGERTPFPLTDGRLSLVSQSETHAVHIGVSYSQNPTSSDDFEIFYRPTEVDLEQGHTCIHAPDPPANITAGTNATFQMFYVGNRQNEPYYACTDITYVTPNDFTTQVENIYCFNATRGGSDPEVDRSGAGTTVLPDENPHHTEEEDSGLSVGAIAGVVVGSVVGATLLGVAAFFLWRRNKKTKAGPAPTQKDVEMAEDSE